MAYEDLDHARLVRLIEVGRTLLSRLEVEELLETVLEAARELTGARYAALGILDEQKEALERFLALGVDPETHRAIGDLPRGRGVLGELIRHPRPLRLADVGAHPRSYGFPPGHPTMRTFLGVPVLVRGEAWGNLYLTEKAGGEQFDAGDEAAVTVLADWTALAVENARLYGGLARQRDELARRQERLERSLRALEVTTDIARAVGGETQLERVLELIVKRGRALVEARALVILLADGDELVVAATAGDTSARLAGARIPVEGSRPGRVLRTREAERLIAAADADALADLGISAEAVMLVPLTFRSTASGVLAAFDRTVGGPEFGLEDERLLRSFAASAGTAVATAQSVESERLRHTIAASEQERRRWARELHDETLQALGGLRMIHSAALKSGDPEALRRAVTESIELIDEEIDSLSALIAELRPAALDELGLAAALRTLAQRKASAGGFEIALEIAEPPAGERLRPELESSVYRLAQEALNNVVKHAGARRVELSLTVGDRIELVVSDDGEGFDPAAPAAGFGLTGMRERAELAGGSLDVSSRPGGGTTVRAVLPRALSAWSQRPGT